MKILGKGLEKGQTLALVDQVEAAEEAHLVALILQVAPPHQVQAQDLTLDLADLLQVPPVLQQMPLHLLRNKKPEKGVSAEVQEEVQVFDKVGALEKGM